MSRTILYLDDELACLKVFKYTFGNEFEVLTASTCSEAYALLSMRPVNIVISDQIMPDMLGTEFLRNVLTCYPESYRVLMTGCATMGNFVSEISTGVIHQFLTKPWTAPEVRQIFERAGARQKGKSGAEMSSALKDRDTHA
jgi:DNA-binding NtrC family response regulator